MQSPIRRYLPHLLIGLSISLIMVGAYAAVGFASLTAPKAVWTLNPLTLKFSGNNGAGTGSASDPFKCAPAISSSVTLQPTVSNLAKIRLTLSQRSFTTCGQMFNPLTVTVHCLVTNCGGSYTGTIRIFQGYTVITPDLIVDITVN